MVMRMNKLKSRQKMEKFHAKGERIKECRSEIFLFLKHFPLNYPVLKGEH